MNRCDADGVVDLSPEDWAMPIWLPVRKGSARGFWFVAGLQCCCVGIPQFGEAPDPQACGHCSSCQALKSGNHGGYLEISTEGSGPVEIARMREILHFLSLRADGRRVILIDSADQLREEAANALLKILEEPPAETHFPLVSHRPARLLKTIVSRCQRWLLGPLARDPFRDPRSPWCYR